MKFIVALATMFASMAGTADEDFSYWETAATCQPGRRDHRCVGYQAILELHHLGDEYCGLINETTDRHSPTAWFSGRRDERGFLVRFVDSFQDGDDAFGWARIEIQGNRLAWIVLLRPVGARIEDERRFHLAASPTAARDDNASSCTELESRSSGLSVHLPPMPEAASSARR